MPLKPKGLLDMKENVKTLVRRKNDKRTDSRRLKMTIGIKF